MMQDSYAAIFDALYNGELENFKSILNASADPVSLLNTVNTTIALDSITEAIARRSDRIEFLQFIMQKLNPDEFKSVFGVKRSFQNSSHQLFGLSEGDIFSKHSVLHAAVSADNKDGLDCIIKQILSHNMPFGDFVDDVMIHQLNKLLKKNFDQDQLETNHLAALKNILNQTDELIFTILKEMRDQLNEKNESIMLFFAENSSQSVIEELLEIKASIRDKNSELNKDSNDLWSKVTPVILSRIKNGSLQLNAKSVKLLSKSDLAEFLDLDRLEWPSTLKDRKNQIREIITDCVHKKLNEENNHYENINYKNGFLEFMRSIIDAILGGLAQVNDFAYKEFEQRFAEQHAQALCKELYEKINQSINAFDAETSTKLDGQTFRKSITSVSEYRNNGR